MVENTSVVNKML